MRFWSIMEYVCSGRKGTETDGLESGRIALVRGVLEEALYRGYPAQDAGPFGRGAVLAV